jgi:Formyl transferase
MLCCCTSYSSAFQSTAFAHARSGLLKVATGSVRRHASRLLSAIAADAGPRKKVVFLGTPDVAALSLQRLLEASKEGLGGGFDIALVVTQPPARTGRGKKVVASPVHQLADSHSIAVLTPEKARDPEFLESLRELAPDLCITAAYGQVMLYQYLPMRYHEAALMTEQSADGLHSANGSAYCSSCRRSFWTSQRAAPSTCTPRCCPSTEGPAQCSAACRQGTQPQE